MRLRKLHIQINKPLIGWHHGEKADPSKWPWWKLFHFSYVRISVQPPSVGHRFYLYTRRKAYDLDIYIDNRKHTP
jgi:hypothetical protein